MSFAVRKQSDEIIEAIVESLRTYERDHPHAEIVLYRQNSVSVRIRIIDPSFKDLTRIQRSNLIWTYFHTLSEDEQSEISMLILLTPEEVEKSFANMEFDDPVTSDL